MKRTEADLLAEAPIKNGGADSPALAHERHIARSRDGVGEGGVQPADRTHDAQTVRANNAHAAAARFFKHLALQIGALFFRISLKPADIMMAPFTPAATHSRTTPGTVMAGVTITARSTLSGTAAILA